MRESGTATRKVISPNTGSEIASWREDGPEAIARLIGKMESARTGLRKNPELRKGILENCMAAIQSARDSLAEAIVREVGKKPEEAKAEVEYALSFFAHCRRLLDEYELEMDLANGHSVENVGLGGALLICPFNDPLAGITRKIAPAVASGCPVIVKPSSLAIICAKAMFDAFRNQGVGDEIQMVATGSAQTVACLLSHESIEMVSFTGSTSVGLGLAAKCAKSGKKIVTELGGNCPFVISASADLEAAVDDLLERKLKAAGQACSSVNRVFVDKRVYERFRGKLVERAESVDLAPSNSSPDLGPVRTRNAANGLVELAAKAASTGERYLTGVPAPVERNQPFLYPLTVMESGEASVFDKCETFGPLLSIRPFSDEREFFIRLERERHALAAYFYTGEPEEMLRKLRGLRFGSIGVNSTKIQGADVPTGGFRDAGIGREGGVWGMREFQTTINWKIERPNRFGVKGKLN
ncbi:MAG: aldehyde dehydrogenase family protein [Albidovulum sp.]|nr:aldehyde dehydrogenase family protein [Albidovulum sp.]